jgi:hypothetical protein
MRKFLLITVFVFFSCFSLFSQQARFSFPKEQIQKFQLQALKKLKTGCLEYQQPKTSIEPHSGAGQLMKYKNTVKLPQLNRIGALSKSNPDTLYIVDTLEVTGQWIHNGTIVVANNGFLHFVKANATILGDIYLMGEHPVLEADSSTLYIPQDYFYQRVLFATGGARIAYRNTTVDHSGLSHNIILVDSAKLELSDVINKGFTTNGIYARAQVSINGINEAGEYIMTDAASLTFRNAHTVLLWHHYPAGSHVNFTFPAGDTVYNYHFNNALPGVTGINYDVFADSCYNVMWGLMPESATDVKISDSEIRAIGLWFMGSETVDVSGLVDNSVYSGFDAPLSDRILRLDNCSVTTWSLYPMEHSVVNIKNCIVGEVGTGGNSELNGDQFFCDGSGGYVWTSDSSSMIAGFSYVSGYVRSQANSVLYYAYSSLAGGYPSALQNSLLIVLQSMLQQEPKALDKAAVWYAIIDSPFEAQVGEVVPVTGSVWIDKAPESNWMDFGSYHLFYQLNGDEDWSEIPVDSLNEKRHETLGNWNTEGLQAGQYILKLEIRDSWGNSAEAIKAVSLRPSFGIAEGTRDTRNLFPNPAGDYVYITIPSGESEFSVTINDCAGHTVMKDDVSGFIDGTKLKMNISGLQPGMYLLTVTCRDSNFSKLLGKK